jgi:uncharacterized surface protein with fasciclin (FAS1) repeats
MKRASYILRLPLAVLLLGSILASCNKDVPPAVPIEYPQPSGKSMADIINGDTSYSFLKTALTRAGMLDALANPSSTYTLFAPKNSAFRNSGIPSTAVINALPLTTLVPLLQYHLVPGQIYSSLNIPPTYPNIQLPTAFVFPAPNTNPLVRFSTFPSRRDNGLWVNNVPITTPDIAASNGVMHNVLTLVAPPSRSLWDRINTDTVSTNNKSLAYLRAALIRADSGVAPTSLASLIYTLSYPPVNATVFAPTDSAFRATLTGAIAQALIAQGVPPATALAQATALASTPAVFQNPALFGVLTAQTVKGILVYHVVLNRTFTNNIPTTTTNVQTVLNTVVAAHPGIFITSTFAGPFVSAATVKGIANATASKLYIDKTPTPEPGGSSDQHYYNGVLHKIDQVLLPQ